MLLSKIAYFIIINIIVSVLALLTKYTYSEILLFSLLILLVDLSVFAYQQSLFLAELILKLKEVGEKNDREAAKEIK